jgi:Protein of unknown function (DUF3570)
MQLIKDKKSIKSIRFALAAASASLLSGGTQAKEDNPWQVDSALSVYSESDSRVTAIEPIVAMKKDFGNEHILGLKLTFDSLTGASPNGAIAAKQPQTFTGPSGNQTYQTDAGETPLDDTFKDTRTALSVNWEQPWGERNRVSLGGNFSSEYDFVSTALNAAIARDFNQKNTTISLGINVESDTIEPVGGTPKPLTTVIHTNDKTDSLEDASKEGKSESKDVTDVLLGITQVINRHWITQVNYSYGTSSGYHTDPYKIVTVVDSTGALVDSPVIAGEKWYLHEHRPDSRVRHSVYWGNKYHLTEDVIDFSYRYYTDDWGIDSHTFDIRYRYEFAGNMYLEPRLRWYSQTAADFYQLFLTQGVDTQGDSPTIEFASADHRLGEFTGTTFGVKYGINLSRTSEFNIRLEQYKQTNDVNLPSSYTALQGLDLNPDLSATTLLIGYSFEF